MTHEVDQGMKAPGPRPALRDLSIAAGFALLALALFLWRITDPAKLNFDEIHYVSATRLLMDFAALPNREHPPLGKYLIGLGMALFGDTPLGWRIMSAVFGATLVFAGVMAARWLFQRRAPAVMTGLLLLLSQTLYIQARIAMLDIFMASFLMLAFWMIIAAIRSGFTNRWQLAIAGTCLGLATACKWTSIPLVAVANLSLLVFYWRYRPLALPDRMTTKDRRRPVPLAEAIGWLGPFAILVYFLAFLPYLWLRTDAVSLAGLIPLQFEMLGLQSQALAPHPYQSIWWQWVLDLRPIWYFYEPVEGIQRGVLFIGNPVICWGGLAALLACLWAGWRGTARALLVPPLLWLAALAFFILIPKSVQFYYHYFVPSLLLCFACAGALDHYFWQRGRRLPVWLAIGFAALVFLEFYPILSAAPLGGPQDFLRWVWLPSWS